MGNRQLYIFDLGNVVLQQVDVTPAIVSILADAAEHYLYRYEFHLDELMTGRMSAADFWATVGKDAKTPIAVDYLAECFSPVPDPAVIKILDELRASGKRVVCGTNTYESHYQIFKDLEALTHFDEVYASQIMGCAKPEGAFYTYIMEREGFSPEDVFFIDDKLENVIGAKALGITAIQFFDAVELRIALDLPPTE